MCPSPLSAPAIFTGWEGLFYCGKGDTLHVVHMLQEGWGPDRPWERTGAGIHAVPHPQMGK